MTGGPLDGVLVVALEQAVAAPLASCRLAEAGARVIKVERPEGDFARGYDRYANGVSSYFAWLNRGKESIVLDLREPADRELMERVIAQADVFIQNLSVGATDRLGLGSATLLERHPSLVVCDVTGYGSRGPYAHRKAYDLLVQAESGLLSVSGPPGELGRVGVSVADLSTGLNAALAITQALYRSARSGTGAHLSVSLFDSLADWMTVPYLQFTATGAPPARVGLAHPSIAPYGAFASEEGTPVLISIQSDREWAVLCGAVLQRDDLVDDPRFATNPARVEHRHLTDAIVAEAFSQLAVDELVELLTRSRIAFGVLNDVAGLAAHPQLRLAEVAHELGAVTLPAPPVHTDWPQVGPAPSLDEHGDRIRREFAAT